MSYAIMRSLAKDPAERFATTKEFFEALSFPVEGLAASGGYAVAPASMLAAGGAGVMLAPKPPADAAPIASSGVVSSPDPRGKTQLGAAAQDGPPGAPPVYGAPPPAPPYGSGPPPFAQAPPPYGTPSAGNLAVPPRRGRSGGGALIAVLAVGGLLALGGIVFAVTHGSARGGGRGSMPSATAPVAADTDASDGGDTSDAANGQAVATDRHHRHPPPLPLIDTALPSLPSGADPADHPPGHHTDSGVAPTPPPPPASDSKDCKNARSLQAKIAQDPSPSPKLLHNFAKDRAKCISEGGHL
jgi:hypothetical protein